MKQSIRMKMKSHLGALLFLVIGVCTQGHASTVVSREGGFIYYRSSFVHLSATDQKEIIDLSVELLKDELGYVSQQSGGPRTLSHLVMDSDKLDVLVSKAQASVAVDSSHGARSLLPAGLLVFAGGSGNVGLGLHGAASGDFGLVIVPTKVTRVNTITQTSVTYFELDWAIVVVPHAHVGVGAGGGVSGCIGAGIIFGDLNQAKDFRGYVISGSGHARLGVGIGLKGSLIYDQFSKKTYGMTSIEYSLGPEASASADGEAGYIQPLSEVIQWMGGKSDTLNGTSRILDPNAIK